MAPANRRFSAYLRIFMSPTAGKIVIEGKISSLFNSSPGLDMDDTGYENILTCGMFLG